MFAAEANQRLLKWVSVEGQEYSPSPVQVYFRGLFNPIPEVYICGTYSESDYLEAELLEDRGLGEEGFLFRPKALDGCLVRLIPRWENKQFDGRVASFSRLKLLIGERRHYYRLRITWYERYDGGFRPVASIVSAQCFTIGAHQGKRKPGDRRLAPPLAAESLRSSSSGSAVDMQVSKRKRTAELPLGPLSGPPDIPLPSSPDITRVSLSHLPDDLVAFLSCYLTPETLLHESVSWDAPTESCATPTAFCNKLSSAQPLDVLTVSRH